MRSAARAARAAEQPRRSRESAILLSSHQSAQPSAYRRYENELALQWASFSAEAPVLIEDESAHVGRCSVPAGLWSRMRAPDALVLRLDVPRETRIARLVGEYGVRGAAELAPCVLALRKRLGAELAARAWRAERPNPPPDAGRTVADRAAEPST